MRDASVALRRLAYTLLLCCAALSASSAHAQSAAPPPTGRLDGVAYDSVYARPLARASIQIAFAANVSVTRTVTADDHGRFAFDSLTPGQWIVGASHPWLDSLAIVQLTIGVDVKARGTTHAVVAVPSARALIAQECGAGVVNDSSGYLFGTVRGATAPHAPTAGTVRLEWPESEIVNGTFRRRVRELRIPTTPTGEYSACGVPPDGLLRIQAWSGADSTGVLLTDVPPHGIGRLDLTLGVARTVPLADSVRASDSLAVFERDSARTTNTLTLLRGSGAIRGVAQTVAGAPIANAHISVWGTGIDATTGVDGRFSLVDLPSGSRILDVRAIGYQSVRRVVVIADNEPTVVIAALDKPVDLTPIQIRAARGRMLGPDMRGFEQRRKGAIGRFLDATQLARINAITPTDYFRQIPSVRVVPGPYGDRVVFRSSLRGMCEPTFYVNGVPVGGFNTLEMYVNAPGIIGVEIYDNPVLVPTEFAAQTPCGSIVIWTALEPDTPKKKAKK